MKRKTKHHRTLTLSKTVLKHLNRNSDPLKEIDRFFKQGYKHEN